MLDQMTALLFQLYARLFLLSIFTSVDFWSSMSCILLDVELAYENVVESSDFFDGNVQG